MNLTKPSTSYRKSPITATEFPNLKFSYAPSADGIDEHLLILFHGLGDKPSNFLRFGVTMNLPQTAILSLGGPCPIPGMSPDSEGSGWFPAFTNDGDDIAPTSEIARVGSNKTRQLLLSFLRKCVFVEGRWKEKPRKVLFFGFSQGACVALDLVLGMMKEEGEERIGGVVAMCGWLEQGMGCKCAEKEGVNVMVVQGTRDPLISVAEAKGKEVYLRSLLADPKNLDVVWVEGKDHCLPGKDYGEMQRIMAFFASHMALRNIKLEAMSDVYEVK